MSCLKTERLEKYSSELSRNSEILTFDSKILDIYELLSYLFLREKYILHCLLIAASLKFCYFSLDFFKKFKRT